MRYLEDYGLTWVGDGDGEKDDRARSEGEAEPQEDGGGTCAASGAAGDSHPSSPTSGGWSPQQGVNIDIQTLASSVEGLNSMVEKAGARIVSDRVGGAVHARLVADDQLPLPLTIFRDGLKLCDGPFQV